MLDNRMVAERHRPEMPTVEPESNEALMEREQRESRELKAAEYAEGLHEVADLIASQPALTPTLSLVYVMFSEREAFLTAVAALTKGSRVGEIRKFVNDPNDERWAEYRCERKFGPVELTLCIKRKLLCRLITPAQAAVYDCPDSLLEEAAEYKGSAA